MNTQKLRSLKPKEYFFYSVNPVYYHFYSIISFFYCISLNYIVALIIFRTENVSW